MKYLTTVTWIISGLLIGALFQCATLAAPPALKPVKREALFAFSQKPSVKIKGDAVTISFAIKGACDVAVAVEGPNGRILRHLAAGVLGKNAPAPFKKNSLKQTLVWNGKDDLGQYVDNKKTCRVRVSLGLKAHFERTLFWSPHKRTRSTKYMGHHQAIMTATAEGVYVCDGGNGEHVRLFDHEGNYRRTVYPPPADKLKDIKGLIWRKFPQDGKRLPLKGGGPLNTFLTTSVTGDISRWNIRQGGGVKGMAVHGKWLYLANMRLNRLGTDGGTGGLSLHGPTLWNTVKLRSMAEYKGGIEKLAPESMACSPDGKWLYLSGFMYIRSWRLGGLNGVARLSTAPGANPEIFAGHLKQGQPGKKDGQFDMASCVATDGKGRVYVGDYGNNRLQVFSPQGKHLKNIPVSRPSQICVNPKNGEIYVFSWTLPYNRDQTKPALTRFGPLDNPKKLAGYPLNVINSLQPGNSCRATVDFWASPPTIWLCESGAKERWLPADIKRANIHLLVEKNGRLHKKLDFHKEAGKEVVFTRPPRHGKQRLFFDFKNKRLYVGELFDPSPLHITSMSDAARIDPETGKTEWINLPFDAEDMAFDMEGMAYLRTENRIARFDARIWREVPFDYGEEFASITTWGLRSATIMSALTFSGGFEASSQLGGMAVSPKGHVVVTAFNPAKSVERKGVKSIHGLQTKKYIPQLYPGRARPWEIHVWDKHGKPLYIDAVAGIGRPVGIRMDEDDNIYLMMAGRGDVGAKRYYNPISCAYIKTRPGSRFLDSESIIPLPAAQQPGRRPEISDADFAGDIWTEGAQWVRGGVGIDGKRNGCHCESQSRPALDYFARSFLPEVDHYSVLVLDSNGNEILRIGRYGNVDDGLPLEKKGGPTHPRSIGGDEVAIMHGQHLAVQSDRRLFIGDLGNARVVSVKLDYHADEVVALRQE